MRTSVLPFSYYLIQNAHQGFNKIFKTICALMLLITSSQFAFSQAAGTAQFQNLIVGSQADNAFPLNSATDDVQWIYGPNAFYTGGVSTGAQPGMGNIIKVYFQLGATTSSVASYTNFTIKLAQNVGTITTWPGATYNTGMTTVFTASSFVITGATAGGWFGVQLTTPFYYNPALSLAVELSVTAGTGNQVRQFSGTGNQRIWGTTGSSSGSTGAGLEQFGFNVSSSSYNDIGVLSIDSPTVYCNSGLYPVYATFKNFGRNQVSYATVKWSVNGVTQTPYIFSGTLDTLGGSGSSAIQVQLGYYSFSSSLATVKAWTYQPNGVNDTVPINDSATTVKQPSMNGTYTINSGLPSSSTNFQTFAAAVTALTNMGICGPVLFSVAAGTYTQTTALTIPLITGSSSTNTITFDGGAGNASTRIITGAISSSAVVIINQQKYVTLRNLTITNTTAASTACAGVAIVGSGSTSNGTGCSVVNCKINIALQATTSSSGYGIIATATAAGNGLTSMGADSLIIDSNTITGGAYGIIIYGQLNASFNRGHKIRGNNIVSCNYMGSYIYGNYNPIDFLNNTLGMNSSYGYYGIYFVSNTNSSTTTSTRIWNNRVTNFGGYGIYLSAAGGTSTAPVQVYNNQVINNPTSYAGYYGIYNSSSYGEFYHNTVIMGFAGTSTTYTCFYNASANAWIKNNVFGVLNGSTCPIYCSTSPSGNQLNYNLYYNLSGSSTLGYRNATFFTAANYLSSTYGGDSSYNYTPVYGNPGAGVYSLTSNCGASGVDLISGGLPYTVGLDSFDINGVLRTIPPTIGAYQYSGTANDFAVLSIMSPTYPLTAGTQPVQVKVANYGTTAIYSATMYLKLNGGTPVSVSYYSAIGLYPCQVDSVSFSGITLLTGSNTLKIYSSLPNFTADGNRNNDTINVIIGTPMSGNYTINSVLPASSTNYQSIAASISDLQVRGVIGPVTFNIRTATYNEFMDPGTVTIPGLSAANYVTYQSQAGIPDSVVISPTSNSFAVKFTNLSYFNFKNLTLNQPQTANSSVIFSGMLSSYDTLYNCKITIPVQTSTSYIVSSNGANINNIVFRKCTFTGGYYGLYLYNTTTPYVGSNIVIDSNTFTSIYYYDVYLYYNTVNMKVRGNTFNLNNASGTGYIYIYYPDSAYEFGGNTINILSPVTTCYMYLAYYGQGNITTHGKIYNNKVVNSNSATVYGYAGYYGQYQDFYNNNFSLGGGYIYTGYSNYIRWYNNTINSTSTTGTIYNYAVGYTGNEYKNNVFSNTGGGPPIYISSGTLGATELYDYNNYYSSGTNLFYYNTTNYNLIAWKSLPVNMGTARDRNSLSYSPGFTSLVAPWNLAPNTSSDVAVWSLKGRAMPVSWIPNDILGNARSTTVYNGPTCIGAFEFTPPGTLLPPLCTISPSSTPAIYTTQYFLFGLDTLASVSWQGAVPSSIGLRVYPGYTPPQIGLAAGYADYTKVYWNFTSNSGSFLYNIGLHFKDNWMGTIPSKAGMIGAALFQGAPWIANIWYSSTVDSIMDTIGYTYLSNMTNAYFAGTTYMNPLPIKLDRFAAVRSGNNALLNWTTASENNADHFDIERSDDGKNFMLAGRVKSSGNGIGIYDYSFTDVSVAPSNGINKSICYRLKLVDRNGSFSNSNISCISFDETNSDVSVFPNPTHQELNLKIMASHDGQSKVTVIDITGRKMFESMVNVIQGTNTVALSEGTALPKGVYFLKFESTDQSSMIKFVKE